MKKALLIVGLATASSLLGGCVAVYEEYRPVPPCVIYGPPCGVVEVVPVPPPPPHWHYYHHPRHW